MVRLGRSATRSRSSQFTESGSQSGTRSVKKIIVERRRVTPSPEAQYRYELDRWEKLPKTDYTYARTITYQRHSPSKLIESPNMARRRIKAANVRQRLFSGDSRRSLSRSSRRSPNRSPRRSPSPKRRSRSPSPSRRSTRSNPSMYEGDYGEDDYIDLDSVDSHEVGRTASSTRSGRSYGSRSRSSVAESKRREYAGLSTGHKESSRKTKHSKYHPINLHGLDTDEEVDEEIDSASAYSGRTSQASFVTSSARSLRSIIIRSFGFLFSTVATLFRAGFYVMLSPYYILVHAKNSIMTEVKRRFESEKHIRLDQQDNAIISEPQMSTKTRQTITQRSYGMSTRSTKRTSTTVSQKSALYESEDELWDGPEVQAVAVDYVDSGARRRVISTFFSGVKSFNSAVYKMLERSVRFVCYGFLYVLYMIYSFIQTAVKFASSSITKIPSVISSVFSSVLSTLYTGVTTILRAPYRGTKTVLSSSYTYTSMFIGNIFTTICSGISRFSSAVYSGSSSTVFSAYSGSRNAATSVFSGSKWVIYSAANGIYTTISKICSGSKYVLVTIMGGSKSTITSVANGIYNKIYTGISKIFGGSKWVICSLADWLTHCAVSVYNGMKRVLSSVFAHTQSAVTTLLSSLKNALFAVVRGLIFLPVALYKGVSKATSNALSSTTSHESTNEITVEHVSTRTTRRKSARLSKVSQTSAVILSESQESAVTVSESQSKGYFAELLEDSWMNIRWFFSSLWVFDTWLLRGRGCAFCFLPLLLFLPLIFSGMYIVHEDANLRNNINQVLFSDGYLEEVETATKIGDGPQIPVISTDGAATSFLTEGQIRLLIDSTFKNEMKAYSREQKALYNEIITQQTKLEKDFSVLSAQVRNQLKVDLEHSSTREDHSNQLLLVSQRLQYIEGLMKQLEESQQNLSLESKQEHLRMNMTLEGLKASHSTEREAALISLFHSLEDSISGKESELRGLFVDIVKAELSGYASKEEMEQKLLEISVRIDKISKQNSDLANKVNINSEMANHRLENLMANISHITLLINEWNLKFDTLKESMARNVDGVKNSLATDAGKAVAEIDNLQSTVAMLNAEIEKIKAAGFVKAEDVATTYEDLSNVKSEMVYKTELEEIRNRLENVADTYSQAAAMGGLDQGAVYAGLSEDQISGMISKAIATYHADRTGKVDFALESAGGSIVSIRCSETYPVKTAQLSIWGIPLWYTSSSPRSIIQPDVYPGQCWAMTGNKGFVVISLAAYVGLTEFSVEHIPKELAPDGNISSAPKEFSVWGLRHVKEFPGTNLGNYTYEESGTPIQYFTVQAPGEHVFSLVELRIHSNWGNERYTCLYRFRVHGRLKDWVHDPQKDNKDEL